MGPLVWIKYKSEVEKFRVQGSGLKTFETAHIGGILVFIVFIKPFHPMEYVADTPDLDQNGKRCPSVATIEP